MVRNLMLFAMTVDEERLRRVAVSSATGSAAGGLRDELTPFPRAWLAS